MCELKGEKLFKKGKLLKKIEVTEKLAKNTTVVKKSN